MSWFSRKRSLVPSPEGPFEKLKIALVSDDLTRTALGHECAVKDVTPRNFRRVLRDWKPDLLLVESSWRGSGDTWRYKIASYPDHPRRTNAALARVVSEARDRGIPAIFWNREDGVHFERFIDSAKLFDRVLTVDSTTIPAYRDALGDGAKVGTMMFAASHALHRPTFDDPKRRAVFVGSYSTHVHDTRRAWQDAMFMAAQPIGLTIYDRNSDRKAQYHRYPYHDWIEIRPAVPHDATPAIYRDHLVNLNVNTIVDSPSAFSRRLVEVLACGGFVLSNRTLAIETHFARLCMASDDGDEAHAFFERVARDGLNASEEEMRREAASHVHEHHSWTARIPIILDMAG